MVLEFGFYSSILYTFNAFSYTEIPFDYLHFTYPHYKKLLPAPSTTPLQLPFEFFADAIFHYTLKFKV